MQVEIRLFSLLPQELRQQFLMHFFDLFLVRLLRLFR